MIAPDVVLTAPCTRLRVHAAHPITAVDPASPAVVLVFSCPGWAPGAKR